MEFKVVEYEVGPSNNREVREKVVAVPAVEDGVFVVDHGEHHGKRVYDALDVRASEEELELVRSGDISNVEDNFTPNNERPGYYKVARNVASVCITFSGTRNRLHADVEEVLELMPAADAVRVG